MEGFAMPKKQSSPKLSTIAAKGMLHPDKLTNAQIKALSASVLAQDEKKGQGGTKKKQ
jgi:hypothetical protein